NAEALRGGPCDEAFGVNGAPQMSVQVAAFRHPLQERAQRGAIRARCLEACGSGDRVEVAYDHWNTDADENGRQQNDSNNDPTLHGVPRRPQLGAEARTAYRGGEGGRCGVQVNAAGRSRSKVTVPLSQSLGFGTLGHPRSTVPLSQRLGSGTLGQLGVPQYR